MRPSVGRSKKRAEAVAGQDVVHPARCQSRVRLEDGGRPRGLQTSVRSASTRRLYGRDEQATHRRDAAACGSGTGPAALCGLRIRAKGVADLFMFFEPLRGRRRVWITPQRRKVEWAWCVKQLLDENISGGDLVLVCDNLIPTRVGHCTRRFPPRRRGDWGATGSPLHPQARQLVEHGGDGTERPCRPSLDRRIDEVAVLRSEVGPWEDHRNRTEAKVRWRFTTEDARSSWRNCIRVRVPRSSWTSAPDELIKNRVTAVVYV